MGNYRILIGGIDMTREKNVKLQERLAVASFTVGVVISLACLFLVDPIGSITTSAMSIVGQFLVLCGSLLGISANFDMKFERLKRKIGDNEGNEE